VQESDDGRGGTQELITELKQLAKQPDGATIAAIAAVADNLRRLGDVYRQRHRKLDDAAVAAHALLADSLPEISWHSRLAMDAALGITVRGRSQSERQKEVNAALKAKDPKRVGYSRGAFRNWNKSAYEEFAVRLLSRAFDPQVQAFTSADTDPAAILGYSIRNIESYYRLMPGRLVGLLIVKTTIQTLRAGHFTYLAQHEYLSEPSAQITVTPVFGCRLVGQVAEGGMQIAILDLVRDLGPDEQFTFIHRVQVDTTQPMESILFISPETAVAEASIAVEFADEIPESVTKFEHLTTAQRRSGLLRAVSSGGVPPLLAESASWKSLQRGLCYGLRWSWKTGLG
jgi:hypothetical protein